MTESHDEQELQALLASTAPPVPASNLSLRVVGVARNQVKTRDLLIHTLLRIWQPLLMLSSLSIRWWLGNHETTNRQQSSSRRTAWKH